MTIRNPGGNQGGLKEFNERMILHVIRRCGSIPSAEIARRTGLSTQTVSVVVNRLLNSNLLRKQDRRRIKGKVGQPSMPIALNPDGAYSIGIKIGRRSLDVLVVDFVGNVLQQITDRYTYPDPEFVLPRVEANVATVLSVLSDAQHQRVVGIGVAAPYGIGDRSQELSGPSEILQQWQGIDLRQQIATHQDLPVWFEHDAKAACIADLILHSDGSRLDNYLYIFIGTIIGGAAVLDGVLFRGPFGYAGAVGPMLIPSSFDPKTNGADRTMVPLLRCASRYLLDEQLEQLGLEPHSAVPTSRQGKPFLMPTEASEVIDAWINTSAAAIAVAISNAASIIDFQGVVIDGALPQEIVTKLTECIDVQLDQLDFTGIVRPDLITGTIGNDARALGGAILPLYSSFAPDKEVFLNLASGVAK